MPAVQPSPESPSDAIGPFPNVQTQSSSLELTVYTRYEHGNLPVRVFQSPETGDTNYEVTYPSGKKVFSSARSMISEFYGHDVHMPFDRYFRLGRYRPKNNKRGTGGANLLRLLDRSAPTESVITVHANADQVSKPSQSTSLAVSKTQIVEVKQQNSEDGSFDEFFGAMKKELQAPDEFEGLTGDSMWDAEVDAAFEKALNLEMDRIEEKVGIDLTARGHEVRKLLFAGFAGKMLSRGYDGEDVLQEIYRGLVVRNRGKCPWDKRKSSFGHYVHMAINCILTNYHRKESKRIDRDALPLEKSSKDGDELTDMGWLGHTDIHHGTEIGDMMALKALQDYLLELPDRKPEAEVGRVILPMVTAGYTRREIVAETSYKEGLVSRALAWIRRQTALWATEMGMGRGVPLKYRLA